MNSRCIEREEIIDKLKKYFPEFSFNDDNTIFKVYNYHMKIPTGWKATDKYSGVYEGAELLSMLVEDVLWHKIAYENKLDIKEDFMKIESITKLEIERLGKEGIYEQQTI